ncbi:MAG: sigma-70 family RNA polymerase sigma factor [Planctomycetes bacterium]|nr:sigma-70 family RNA polymerase sigma factor [Planctomycetota bacterium]MCB9870794.1 sigma-70 family RNA polymerase sigma factor [Planctomycetota bacterium]
MPPQKTQDSQLAADWLAYRDRGDAEALARVFDHTAPRLMLVAMHLVRDQDQAEDVLQATFLAAMKSKDTYSGDGPLLAWLTRILTNRATDLFRATRRARIERGDAPEPAVDSDPSAMAMSRETVQQITAAIDTMQGPLRRVLMLRLVHGLRTIEIARATGHSTDTVRSQLSRAMKALRERLPTSVVVPGAIAALTPDCLASVRSNVVAAAGGSPPVVPSTGASRLKLWAIAGTACLAGLTVWALQSSPSVPVTPPGTTAGPIVTSVGATAPIRRIPTQADTPTKPDKPPPDAFVWRVVYTDGTPAVGITVSAGGVLANLEGRPQPSFVTDSNGRVDTDKLPPGRYWLQRGAGESVLAETGRDAVLKVDHGFEVRGRVVDAEDRPVPAAQVWMSFNQTGLEGRVVAQTDFTGSFRIPGGAPGLFVMARDEAHAWSARYKLEKSRLAAVGLAIRLLSAPSRIHGVVRDDRGSPVVGVNVLAMRMSDTISGLNPDGPHTRVASPTKVETDANGEYEILDQSPGVYVLEVGRTPGGFAAQQLRIEVATGGVRRDITLARGWTLTGVVQDKTGRPLPGAAVEVWDGPLTSYWERTDASGRFELSCVTAGEITVRASVPGQGQASAKVSGSPLESKHCVLVPDPGTFVRGRLVDESGTPIANWIVVVQPLERLRQTHDSGIALSDAEGRFLVANLAATQLYGISCQPRWLGPRHFARLFRASGLGEFGDIVIRRDHAPTARVIGRFLKRDGTPLRGARVGLLSGVDGSEKTTFVDPKTGEFELRECEAGTFQVTLDAPPLPRVGVVIVELRADKLVNLGTRRISGPSTVVVHLPEGPDPQWMAFLLDVATSQARSLKLRNGRFEAPVDGRKYVVHVGSAKHAQETIEIEAKIPEQTHDLRPVFRKGTTVELALDFESAPHHFDVRIVDRANKQVFLWAQVGSVPSLRFACAPGDYVMHIRSSSGRRLSQPLSVGSETVKVSIKI